MGRSTPKSNGSNAYKHSVNFDAKGDKHSHRDMKAYIKNREYAPHLPKVYLCALAGCILFVAVLVASMKQMEKDNAPVYLLLGSMAMSTTFGEQAYTNHNIKLRNVLFPPSAKHSSWLVLCGEEGKPVPPVFVQVAKHLHDKSLSNLNGTSRLSLGVANCNEHKYLPNLFLPTKDQTPRLSKIKKKELLSLEHGLRLKKILATNTATKTKTRSPTSPTSPTSPPPPMMFLTSYRRKMYQLQEQDMTTMKTMLKTMSQHNNFNLKLTTLKDNKSLYASCLEDSSKRTERGGAEACVLVLRRGDLEDDVRQSIKNTMLKHRHLNFVQIDLDEYALQPMPLHDKVRRQDSSSRKKRKTKKKPKKYAHQWPRIAIARSIRPVETKTKKKKNKKGKKEKDKDKDKKGHTKKKKKKKKKKAPPAVSIQKIKKDTIVWRWYPSSLMLVDESALNDFIETADASGWSLLDALPSQLSKRLRIVRAR